MANGMAKVLESVIRMGNLPLSSMSERIETMYLAGRIDGEERLNLIEMMHANADPSKESGDYKALYEALTVKYNELAARVKAIEEQLGGGSQGDETTEESESWESWDGVSDQYQKGAVVVHDGRIWESVYDGQNVWEPGSPGIDERYWKELVTSDPDEEE